MKGYRIALLTEEDGARERTEQTAVRNAAGEYLFAAENGDRFRVRCGPVCSVSREGEISYRMVFSPGECTETVLETPYGTVRGRVRTYALERREDGFSVVYALGFPETEGRRKTDFRILPEVEI